ncbi:MAG: hypothetical protein HQ502_09195 [Alphaproteobacteria bacterium]|nr:hypothetical protein [Alphaproteobacteria bacterium]
MSRSGGLSVAAILAAILLCVSPASVRAQAVVGNLALAAPQPGPDARSPGLAVEYIRLSARHVDDVESAGKGIPGEPLEMLDWNVGDGPVLTHADDDGIGARITGFINFPKAGDYLMAMQSNDGVRLFIGGQLVVEDPGVHGDRFSPNVTVQVRQAGWYPLYLLYFERKGTSTLELYWQPPGTEGFDFVPAEAFAHGKKA